MNHEHAQLYGEPRIQKVGKSGRVRWVKHVVTTSVNNPAEMVFTLNLADAAEEEEECIEQAV